MSKAVVLENYGAPSVMKIISLQDAKLNANEVLVKQVAIGVNFLDTQVRSGNKKLNDIEKKIILGYEASGIIQEVGSDVDGFKVGDRVAYATGPIGAYRDFRVVDQKYLIALPETISFDIAAASLFKGLTAHYLSSRAFLIRPGTAVLIHAAASGVGQILAQIANIRGAVVIGTVGSEAKKQIALDSGCHKVFNYKIDNWVANVIEITNGIGITAVFDSLGETVFEKSLDCLMKMGVMISYGDTTGAVKEVNAHKLKERSLFATFPSIFDYKENRMELLLSAHDIFSMIESGQIKINIAQLFKLEQVVEAHTFVESGAASGSIIMTT